MDAVAEEDTALLGVKFYTDEQKRQDSQNNSEEGKDTDNGQRIRKISKSYKHWTSKGASFSKSTESEDSGVKSVSSSDDRSGRVRFGLSRQVSTSASTPLFDFPTFDELFENQGEFSLTFHTSQMKKTSGQSRISTSDFQQLRGVSFTDSEKGYDDATDVSKSADKLEEIPKEKPPLTRQDSIMIQKLSETIYLSWEASKGFLGFRHKLGNNLRHKYCMLCRLHSTIFIFMYVVFGMALTSAGTVCWMQCHSEIMVSLYLVIDGLMSVLLFPILLMDWTKKIGGCVSEKNKEGTGIFWPVILILKVAMVALGTFVVIYRYYVQEKRWTADLCEMELYITISAVMFEWVFLLLVIALPVLIYAIIYFFAPAFVK